MLAAAVLGSPIDHSLSPLLHESAYRALGLNDWTYTQIECTASDLPRIVSAADPGMRGFSVTRPCKDAALRFADVVSERAHIVESANTLIRRGTEWYADCTDIDGACASLKKSGYTGGNVLLLGAGGTSPLRRQRQMCIRDRSRRSRESRYCVACRGTCTTHVACCCTARTGLFLDTSQ